MTFFINNGRTANELAPTTVSIEDGGTGEVTAGAALIALGGLNLSDHDGIDHKVGPHNLLGAADHDALDHRAAAVPGLGKLIQVSTLNFTGFFGTTAGFSTTPLVTEGLFLFNGSFTPTSATNRILLILSTFLDISFQTVQCMVFRDSVAKFACHFQGNSQQTKGTTAKTHEELSGTTSLITYSLRLGASGGQTGFINGSPYLPAADFATHLTIMEIEP